MLPDTTLQDRVIDDIKENAGVMSVDKLKDLLAEGRRQRPMGYDETSKSFAQRYSGDQVQLLRDKLKQTYKNTWQNMPVDPVGWMRFLARQDAGVYNVPATRKLVVGEEPVADEAQQAYHEIVEEADIDGVMLEIERRAKTGIKAAVVVVGWRKVTADDPGKLVLHTYWPHDVVTISHPSMPDEPDAIMACAIRQARTDTGVKSDLWWVWTRDVEEDALGNVVSFGPWNHRRVSEDGNITTPTQSYDATLLPAVFLRLESGAGGIWPEPHKDVIANVDNLNVARSNRQHVVNMQAHSILVVNSKTKEEADIVVAPDVPLIFQEESGSAQYLTAGADHDAILGSVTRDLEEIGISRGNSADAYAVEPGQAQSGVARLIANAPHDQLVSESVPTFKHFEERVLGPVVIDVINAFSPVTLPADCRVSIEMGKGKSYEDDKAKTDRVLALKNAGLIDDAKALMMLGLADSREEAEEMLAEMQPAPQPTLPGRLQGSPFSPRETTTPPTPETTQ